MADRQPDMSIKKGTFELQLNITTALRSALKDKAAPTMTIFLVPVGVDRKPTRDVDLTGSSCT